MRICIISSVGFPPREGIGFYVFNLAKKLLSQGHEVQVVTRGVIKNSMVNYVDGIKIWRVRFAPIYPFHVHFHGIFVNKLLHRLEDELDIIHVHTPLSPHVKTQLPIITTVHSSRRAAVHSVPVRDISSFANWLMIPFSNEIESKLLESSKIITTTSTTVAKQISEFSINPSKVRVLGNGVDHNLFVPPETLDNSSPYILYVGRLHRQKGVLDLVDCAKRVIGQNYKIKFVIVGEGPLESKLRKIIFANGISDRFRIINHISFDRRQELISLYQNAAIVVHPSYYEGLPTTLLEAMACNKPVIATAVSGALDLICSGKNGLLVPTKQPDELAKAILYLIEHEELMRELGDAARKTIENHFSWDTISSEFSQCYEEAIVSS